MININITVIKDAKEYHTKNLQIAKKFAFMSEMVQKHGCIIVHNGKVISYGFNNMICYGYDTPSHLYSYHAEIDAIGRMKKYSKNFLAHCELYVVRVGYKTDYGMLKNSKPCTNCCNKISKTGIGKIYYSV